MAREVSTIFQAFAACSTYCFKFPLPTQPQLQLMLLRSGIPVAAKTLGAKKVISGEVPSAIIISKYLLTYEEPEPRGSLILT